MSKWEELIILLIEPNTVEELRNMLQEDCWSQGVKRIFRKEIERRLSVAQQGHALPGKVLQHPIRAAGDQIRE